MIDINKGDDNHPMLRSLYAGKDFNNGPMDGLFAATPPIEGLRALVSEAAPLDVDEEKVIKLDDLSRAFFEAPATREVCVEMQEEALSQEERGQDLVRYLIMSLYGTLDTAMNWQEEIAAFMTTAGFTRGRCNPC